MMEHKGYKAHIEFDNGDDILHGRVINTRDVITFEGTSVDQLRRAFIDSVEDYLEFCAASGEDPEKPFSGRFQVRIPAELHRRIHAAARLERQSLNQYVTWVLDAASLTSDAVASPSSPTHGAHAADNSIARKTNHTGRRKKHRRRGAIE